MPGDYKIQNGQDDCKANQGESCIRSHDLYRYDITRINEIRKPGAKN